MEFAQREEGGTDSAAYECLRRGIAAVAKAAVERRHETLMERAETDFELERSYAEKVYAIADEEQLEPIYAFQLVHCGVGVRELESPEQDEEEALQQVPPEWVAEPQVALTDVELERHLRASFRRLKAHLEEAGDAAAGVETFLAEPDVGRVRLR